VQECSRRTTTGRAREKSRLTCAHEDARHGGRAAVLASFDEVIVAQDENAVAVVVVVGEDDGGEVRRD
jgi:hypothetical protein